MTPTEMLAHIKVYRNKAFELRQKAHKLEADAAKLADQYEANQRAQFYYDRLTEAQKAELIKRLT